MVLLPKRITDYSYFSCLDYIRSESVKIVLKTLKIMNSNFLVKTLGTQKKMHHRTNKNLVKTTKVLLF